MSKVVLSDTKKKMTPSRLMAMKGKEKFTALTAYDRITAKWCEAAGVDVLLVGDSLGNVLYGESSTLPVTLDQMILHTRATRSGVKNALLVTDLPFLSYHTGIEDAVRNAGRLMKESNAEAVKLEGGAEFKEEIKALVRAGIPVMAHIGLKPQSFFLEGKYRSFGKSEAERLQVLEDALAVESAGAFSVVLECVEENLAKEITEKLRIPTIGIGSGSNTDGQILVLHDLLGLDDGHKPKFVEPTGDFFNPIVNSITQYIERTKGNHR